MHRFYKINCLFKGLKNIKQEYARGRGVNYYSKKMINSYVYVKVKMKKQYLSEFLPRHANKKLTPFDACTSRKYFKRRSF